MSTQLLCRQPHRLLSDFTMFLKQLKYSTIYSATRIEALADEHGLENSLPKFTITLHAYQSSSFSHRLEQLPFIIRKKHSYNRRQQSLSTHISPSPSTFIFRIAYHINIIKARTGSNRGRYPHVQNLETWLTSNLNSSIMSTHITSLKLYSEHSNSKHIWDEQSELWVYSLNFHQTTKTFQYSNTIFVI